MNLLAVTSLPWILLAGLLIRWASPNRLVGRVLTVTSIISVTHFGMHQLGTYDVSAIVDLGWRFEQGQTPFRDFPLTLPPTFTAAVRMCWSLLGHSWASLVRGSTAITLGCVFSAWRALSRTVHNSTWNEILVALAIALPHFAIGHIWHSAMVSQLAAVTVLWLVAWRFSPSRGSAAALGLFLGILVLSKPNIAGPLTLVSGAWICMHGKSRHVPTILISLLASLGSVIVLSKADPSRVLTTTVELLSTRSRPTQLLPDGLDSFSKFFFVSTYALLLFAFFASVGAVLNALIRRRPTAKLTILLGAACVLSSLAGMATNWDIKSSDMPLAITGVLLMLWSHDYHGPARLSLRPAPLAVSSVTVALTVLSISIGSSRWRMELTGPMTQREDTTSMRGRVFDGVRAAPLLQAVDQQLSQTISESGDRNIFLGPRLEIFYSRFRLSSPKGLPLWWHQGTSYTSRDNSGINSAFRAAHFSRAIFFKQDFTRFPPELREYLDQNYDADERYSQLTIFWSKSD